MKAKNAGFSAGANWLVQGAQASIRAPAIWLLTAIWALLVQIPFLNLVAIFAFPLMVGIILYLVHQTTHQRPASFKQAFEGYNSAGKLGWTLALVIPMLIYFAALGAVFYPVITHIMEQAPQMQDLAFLQKIQSQDADAQAELTKIIMPFVPEMASAFKWTMLLTFIFSLFTFLYVSLVLFNGQNGIAALIHSAKGMLMNILPTLLFMLMFCICMGLMFIVIGILNVVLISALGFIGQAIGGTISTTIIVVVSTVSSYFAWQSIYGDEATPPDVLPPANSVPM